MNTRWSVLPGRDRSVSSPLRLKSNEISRYSSHPFVSVISIVEVRWNFAKIVVSENGSRTTRAGSVDRLFEYYLSIYWPNRRRFSARSARAPDDRAVTNRFKRIYQSNFSSENCHRKERTTNDERRIYPWLSYATNAFETRRWRVFNLVNDFVSASASSREYLINIGKPNKNIFSVDLFPFFFFFSFQSVPFVIRCFGVILYSQYNEHGMCLFQGYIFMCVCPFFSSCRFNGFTSDELTEHTTTNGDG